MARTLKSVFQDADPNKVADAMRLAKAGQLLQQATVQVRAAVTSHITALPEGLRAMSLLYAYATAGTVTGLMTVVAGGAPTTGQVSLTLNGQVIFATADAVTEAELVFAPYAGDIVDEVLNLSGAGLGTLGGGRAAKLLISAEVLTGAAAGLKTNIARGGSPSAAQACLTVSGRGVQFNAAAASVQARVRYIQSAAPGSAPSELLMTEQNNL